MADLSNITALSSLTITSDQTTGTNNHNATLAIPCVTQEQIDKLENVIPYQVDVNGEQKTCKVKQGTLIFNITKNIFQIFISGLWQTVFSSMTGDITGSDLNGTPLVLPTSNNAILDKQPLNGFLYYNIEAGEIDVYINNKWQTVFTSLKENTEIAAVPLILPKGPADEIEVKENEFHGFIYYNTSQSVLRTYLDEGWETIFSSQMKYDMGNELENGSPLVIPSGESKYIEKSNYEMNGFIYYDTVNKCVRGYINAQWMTLFTVATTATGVGLTNGAPFIFPSGTKAAVEVSANQVNGFTYFDNTNNNLRTFDNGWKTITPT